MYDLQVVIDFLKELEKNNNRDWFNLHKSSYQEAHKHIINFADALLTELHQHDQIETQSGKKSLHRIYKDVRFSKDKTPYNTHFSGGFKRATENLRGGYYFRIQPNQIFVAGGFWGPNSEDLLHIRKQIAQDSTHLRTILSSNEFNTYFVELKGEQLKTAPKGFDIEHPDIDLLRYKQFLLVHQFNDSEALEADFHLKVLDGFLRMRPFFDYMSEILTTDLNGVPLHEN